MAAGRARIGDDGQEVVVRPPTLVAGLVAVLAASVVLAWLAVAQDPDAVPWPLVAAWSVVVVVAAAVRVRPLRADARALRVPGFGTTTIPWEEIESFDLPWRAADRGADLGRFTVRRASGRPVRVVVAGWRGPTAQAEAERVAKLLAALPARWGRPPIPVFDGEGRLRPDRRNENVFSFGG